MRPRHLRFVALGLGIVCLLAMFKPSYSHETPGPGEEYRRFRLGLPFDPWFHYDAIHIDKRVESPTGVTHTYSNRTEYGFELVSWSVLLGVAGIGFLFVARQFKRAAAGEKPGS